METACWGIGGSQQLLQSLIAWYRVLSSNMINLRSSQACTSTAISPRARILLVSLFPLSSYTFCFYFIILIIRDMGGSKLSYLALQNLIGASNMTAPSVVPGIFILFVYYFTNPIFHFIFCLFVCNFVLYYIVCNLFVLLRPHKCTTVLHCICTRMVRRPNSRVPPHPGGNGSPLYSSLQGILSLLFLISLSLLWEFFFWWWGEVRWGGVGWGGVGWWGEVRWGEVRWGEVRRGGVRWASDGPTRPTLEVVGSIPTVTSFFIFYYFFFLSPLFCSFLFFLLMAVYLSSKIGVGPSHQSPILCGDVQLSCGIIHEPWSQV